MRVFITGAAGFIGKATVKELIQNGHQVLGLARSDASAATITKLGGEPHPGSLEDLESLKSGAKASDGVIHLAFIHNFQNLNHSAAVDRAAIEAMGETLAGTGKPLIIASGLLDLAEGRLATEDDKGDPKQALSDRFKADDIIAALSTDKQVRGMIMRFSPTVHGDNDWAFIPMFIKMAREKGKAVYIGDGSSRWPAVHRDDAAVLLRLALEKGRAGGVYHAVAEEGIPIKDIMGTIGKRLNLPVKGTSVEEATGVLGFFATLIAMDNPVSSEKTRKELGWTPTRPGLLEDVEANYFS